MSPDLTLQILAADDIPPPLLAAIHRLCAQAYPGENLQPLWDAYRPDWYALALLNDAPASYAIPVSHAMVVTRWLQAGNGSLLRTAYIELVATLPEFQGQGIATALMQRLAQAIAAAGCYRLAALCPADTQLYRRLHWEYWRGPLSIRPPNAADRTDEMPPEPKNGDAGAASPLPTPEERVMILRLPTTPPLDLDLPLSAEWRPGGELW